MKPQAIITAVVIFIAGYLLYLVFEPFFIPILWAVVFAIIFYPYYAWVLKQTGGSRDVAALIACATIAVFLIIPLALIGSAIATEVYALYQWAEQYVSTVSTHAHNSPVFFPPYIAGFLKQYVGISSVELNNMLAATVKEAVLWTVSGMTGFVMSFTQGVLNAVLAFFAMFYVFRDGRMFLETGMGLVPLADHDKERLVRRMGAVINVTVSCGIIVGAAQGVLGGLAFWALGLDSPMLWGFAMFLLSFLPGIGTALVWGPASVYLLYTGAYFSGVALMLWGAFAVGLIDNLLRSLIVSGAVNLHPLLVFFSIFGAVHAFGLIGIIAGPLILSIAAAALEIYQENNHA